MLYHWEQNYKLFFLKWQVHLVQIWENVCQVFKSEPSYFVCQSFFFSHENEVCSGKKVTSSACNLNCTLAFPQNNYHIWIHSRNYFMHSFHFITQNIKKTLFKVWNFKKVIISTDSSMIFYFKWAVLRRPRWLSGNESIYHSGDMGLIPDPGRSHIPQSN